MHSILFQFDDETVFFPEHNASIIGSISDYVLLLDALTGHMIHDQLQTTSRAVPFHKICGMWSGKPIFLLL